MHNHIDIYSDIPVKFEDRREISSVPEFQEGQPILTSGYCEKIEEKPASTSPVLVVTVNGQGGRFWVKYFHYTHWHIEHFHTGQRIYIWGCPTKDRNMWTFFHPSVPTEIGHICPIYRLRPGETATSKYQAIKHTMDIELAQAKDEVPGELLARRDLPPITDALIAIHTPSEMPEKRHFLRIAYRELFNLKRAAMISPQPPLPIGLSKAHELFHERKITPTHDQDNAIKKIQQDANATKQIKHLIMGDHATGKKTVAAAIAYAAINDGKSVCIIAHSAHAADSYQSYLSLQTQDISQQHHPLLTITTKPYDCQGQQCDLVITDEGPIYGTAQTARLINSHAHHIQLTTSPMTSASIKTLGSIVPITRMKDLTAHKHCRTAVTAKQNIDRLFPDIDPIVESGHRVVIIYPKNESKATLSADLSSKATAWLEKYPKQTLIHKGKAAERKEILNKYADKNAPHILITDRMQELPIEQMDVTAAIINHAEYLPFYKIHQIRTALTLNSDKRVCHLVTDTHAAACDIHVIQDIYDAVELANLDIKRKTPGGEYQNIQEINPFSLPSQTMYQIVEDWVNEDIQTCIKLGIIKDNQQNSKDEIRATAQ